MAQIWLVSLKIVLTFSRFKPTHNLNRFLADLRRGLNSLNSDIDQSSMNQNQIALLLKKLLWFTNSLVYSNLLINTFSKNKTAKMRQIFLV